MRPLAPLALALLLSACGDDAPGCPEGTAPTGGACLPLDGGVASDAEAPRDAGAPRDAAVPDGAALDAAAEQDAGAEPDGCTPRAFYRDTDGDGRGDPAETVSACAAPEGYVEDDTDCDDACDSCYPGGVEVCDEHDNDCDDAVDEEVRLTFYRDADSDGHGDPDVTVTGCAAPDGYVDADSDCNDACDSCHPGGTEVCDERDNDCDGTPDEGVTTTYYRDCDGDGYAAGLVEFVETCGEPAPDRPGCAGWTTRAPSGASSTDCLDVDAEVHPGATFHVGAIPGLSGSARYDWNCDGTPERRWTDGFYCSTTCAGAGWTGAIPACGASAEWRECGYSGGRCSTLFLGSREQECR